ncbi:uncharacterized protein FIBRA_04352 [Fibroporia radiculosa]|uniref:F-box domain-containing protein n=1 Tax=Fibroporia radiculosa TaxID=599839 RepID=J4HWH4_9APHY|nr:uncharacterized protein FIBRA_04352 [Fibroporia radiculosa]CCM02267.1 predicted protein [Fibroporia radiculosa]
MLGLESLEFWDTPKTFFQYISGLPKIIGRQLKFLSLLSVTWFPSFVQWPDVSVLVFTTLRTLQVGNLTLSPRPGCAHVYLWVYSILSNIRAPELKRIELHVGSMDDIGDYNNYNMVDWEEIDRSLARLARDCAARLVVSIHVGFQSVWTNWEETKVAISEQLPTFRSGAGALEFVKGVRSDLSTVSNFASESDFGIIWDTEMEEDYEDD